MTAKTEPKNVPMKWQSRNCPAFPGNEPPWEDCYVRQGEDEPAAGFWLQCEYRKVPRTEVAAK